MGPNFSLFFRFEANSKKPEFNSMYFFSPLENQ